MHAPLARHLVRFERVLPVGVPTEPPVIELVSVVSEPTVTMTVGAFESRLDAEREALRASLAAEHTERRERADAAHTQALAAAVADVAALRDAEEGAAVAARIATAIDALRHSLAEQLAKTLRPLLADAVAARTVAALVETVARVLADPDHPVLTIRGPAARLAAAEAALGTGSVTYEATDGDELHVTANGIRIETRAAAALAALAATEGA